MQGSILRPGGSSTGRPDETERPSDSDVRAPLTRYAETPRGRDPGPLEGIDGRAAFYIRCAQAAARRFEAGEEDVHGLAALAAVLAAFENAYTIALESVHEQGASFAQIGDALGISAPSAFEQYKRRRARDPRSE